MKNLHQQFRKPNQLKNCFVHIRLTVRPADETVLWQCLNLCMFWLWIVYMGILRRTFLTSTKNAQLTDFWFAILLGKSASDNKFSLCTTIWCGMCSTFYALYEKMKNKTSCWIFHILFSWSENRFSSWGLIRYEFDELLPLILFYF